MAKDNKSVENVERLNIIHKRLEEIDDKDIKYIDRQAQQWGKTIVDKDLLDNLKDFNFWKEWKNK